MSEQIEAIIAGAGRGTRDGRREAPERQRLHLKDNLAKADKLAVDFTRSADEYIEKHGIDALSPGAANTDEYDGADGYRQKEILELDLQAAGIRTIVWAAGFNVDYSFVRIPVFDKDGYPIQQRGVTDHPGLYFMGVHYQHKNKSDLFYGVGEDAAYVASVVTARWPDMALPARA